MILPEAESGRRDGQQEFRRPQLVVSGGALFDDHIDTVEEDGVGVVVRERRGLRRRLGIRLGSTSVLTVVVVMPVGTVVMVVVVMMTVVVAGRNRLRVDVRTEIVSGGLAPAVRVAERG